MIKENLERMVSHLESMVDAKKESKFDMSIYSAYDNEIRSPKDIGCISCGCAIGHCVVLDKENVFKHYLNYHGIDYNQWSIDFSGLGKDSYWYCFGSYWNSSLKECIQRIKDVIKQEGLLTTAQLVELRKKQRKYLIPS